jgi:hypothetical protein
MHQLHVSLTTISARLPDVHHVVESLLAQRFERDRFSVNLYLSREPYLLDQGCPAPTLELEHLVERNPGRFTIHYVRNTGPYRKIFPIMDNVYALPQSAFLRSLIVTVDDDTLYPSGWLQGLYAAYLRHNCVIGYRGRSLVLADGKVAPYRQWSRTVLENPSSRNVLTGKDGILYSPLHLHPHVRDEHAALRIAPKADDLWLKAHALLLGVPAYTINDSLAREFPSVELQAQEVSLYNAFNRQGGNDDAIEAIGHHLSVCYERSLVDLMTGAPHGIGHAGLVI